jgi:NAD(P)-dependent dehydrogenase (short-subunit alcohol dehydrogenase family)
MNTRRARTIFITGSSSGLGRAAAKLFASRGWTVVATMRNPDKETELAKLPGIVLYPVDITELHQIENAATRAINGGGVDVVFNNAGYGMSGPLEGLADDQVLRMVNTNLMGPIRTTKAFILQLGDEAFRKTIKQQFFG